MRAFDFINEGFPETKKAFIAAGIPPSDVDSAIAAFRDASSKGKIKDVQHKNIDNWRKAGWEAFKTYVDALASVTTATANRNRSKSIKSAGPLSAADLTGTIPLINTEEWLVTIPLDVEASARIGNMYGISSWCTTKVKQPHFESYFLGGVTLIYCINHSTHGKWAIAVRGYDSSSTRIYDAEDHTIKPQQFKNETGMSVQTLIKSVQQPTIAKRVEEIRNEKLKNSISYRIERCDPAIQDPDLERDILHGGNKTDIKEYLLHMYSYEKTFRWEAAEPVIAQDSDLSLLYAQRLHSPFPAGEPAIATDAYNAYIYATEILHGRFPAGEPTIAKARGLAYPYAIDVLRKKWTGPLKATAEASIMKDVYANKNTYRKLK